MGVEDLPFLAGHGGGIGPAARIFLDVDLILPGDLEVEMLTPPPIVLSGDGTMRAGRGEPAPPWHELVNPIPRQQHAPPTPVPKAPRSVGVVDARVIAVPPIWAAGEHRPAMQPTASSRVVAIVHVIAKADTATATMDVKVVFVEMLAMAEVTAPGGVISGLATAAELHAVIPRGGTATAHAS